MSGPPREKSGQVSRIGGAIRLLGLLIFAGFIIWATYYHRPDLNNEVYFKWGWRDLPIWRVIGSVALCALPFFAGQVLYHRRGAIALSLALAALSSFLLMLACAAIQTDPPNLQNIPLIVRSQNDNGFFADAQTLHGTGMTVGKLLRFYPEISPQLDPHPRNKPPGPLVFNLLLIDLFGNNLRAAMIVGLTVAILAAAAVPGTYVLVARLTGNLTAGFSAASILALCPAPILLCPTFDQSFLIFTIGLVLLWMFALGNGNPISAAAFGLLLGATFFVTYLPAVLAIFLGAYTLIRFRKGNGTRILLLIVIALTSFAVFYVVLWLLTGFNPIATFAACWHNSQETLREMTAQGYLPRKLPGTIPWDLYDFIRGSGWISAFLLGCYILTGWRDTANWRLSLLCVLQFIAVAVLGLIQCETSRVWMFMLPLLMIPIGLELSQWPFAARLATYFALLAITAVMCQSTVFMV